MNTGLDALELERRDYLLYGGVILAVVLVIAGAYTVLSDSPAPSPQNTADRVSDQVSSGDGGLRIDTGKFVEDTDLMGLYRGNMFVKAYGPDGTVEMRITQDITPNDNVPEGYILGYLEEQQGQHVFKAEVFVDDDLQEEVRDLNVAWGASFEHIRPYDGKEISPGLYRDVIVDEDVQRFRADGPGSDVEMNVAVGNFSRDDVQNRRVDGLTMITAR